MKILRSLLMAALTVASLSHPFSALAQSTNPPPVVVPPGDGDLYRDLRGAPTNVVSLIINFDKTRDAYLAQQKALLLQLKGTTTAAEREAIRDALQANRQAFLAELKAFRQELKDELADLKGKISHREFERILDAAKDAATEGGLHHHRGH